MRVYEYAKKHGMTSKEVLENVQELGFEVKTASSALSEEAVGALNDVFVEVSNERKVFVPSKEAVAAVLDKAIDEKRPRASFFKKKARDGKVDRLHPKKYQRPGRRLQMSQKTANRLFWGIAGAFVLLSIGSSVAYLGAKASVQKEAKKLLSGETRSASVDYRAVAFLNGYVSSYFNYAGATAQADALKALNAYYGGDALPMAAQGQQRNPSNYISSQLLSLTDKEAKFVVNYQTGGKSVTTGFDVFYAKAGSGYVVTSYPVFENSSSLVGSANNKWSLSATSQVSDSEKKSLDAFVKSLLTARTKDQASLDLLGDGFTLDSNESLKTIDFVYYTKNDDGSYQAVVQATFADGLGTHAENFNFVVSKNKDSFFASDNSSIISKSDLQIKTNTGGK